MDKSYALFVENTSQTIEPRSKEFLIDLFLGLRSDLEKQLREGGPARPEPRNAARTQSTYEALLSGLTAGAPFPDDEHLSEFVADLARATDAENDYERVMLEHHALEELSMAVSGGHPSRRSRSER